MCARVLALAALVALAACGDNLAPGGPGPGEDGGVDAAVDAPPGLVSCAFDLRGVLPRPPADGVLPCELLPPGFAGP